MWDCDCDFIFVTFSLLLGIVCCILSSIWSIYSPDKYTIHTHIYFPTFIFYIFFGCVTITTGQNRQYKWIASRIACFILWLQRPLHDVNPCMTLLSFVISSYTLCSRTFYFSFFFITFILIMIDDLCLWLFSSEPT